jgi:hypothetical protein
LADARTASKSLEPCGRRNAWLFPSLGHPRPRPLNPWPAYPDKRTRASKFWPAIGRIDNVYGDRNLVCSCVGMEAYADAPKI